MQIIQLAKHISLFVRNLMKLDASSFATSVSRCAFFIFFGQRILESLSSQFKALPVGHDNCLLRLRKRMHFVGFAIRTFDNKDTSNRALEVYFLASIELLYFAFNSGSCSADWDD